MKSPDESEADSAPLAAKLWAYQSDLQREIRNVDPSPFRGFLVNLSITLGEVATALDASSSTLDKVAAEVEALPYTWAKISDGDIPYSGHFIRRDLVLNLLKAKPEGGTRATEPEGRT